MHLAALVPNQREDNTDDHDGHVEEDGLGVGIGDLAPDVGQRGEEADPHDRVEDGSGHTEDGLFPLLGEHVGDLSHIEDEDRSRGVGAQKGHVGDGGDVNTQEERRHGDDVVNEAKSIRISRQGKVYII